MHENPADRTTGAPGGRKQAGVLTMLKPNRFPTRRALAALALAILAAFAFPALAQQARGDADRGDDGPDIPGRTAMADAGDDAADFAPGFLARLERRLDLDDAQHDAIAKIFEAGRARDLPLRKQVRLLEHDLQGEMMKDDPSEKAVLTLARQVGDLRTQMQAGRLQDRLAMRKVLSPEQRDQLMMMREARGGFGPGFGPGFRPGMGPRWMFMGEGRDGGGRHGGEGMDDGRRGGGRGRHERQAEQKTE